MASRAVAVFDFDHTLIKGESLWAFLVAVAGWPRALLALAEGLAKAAGREDWRTALKAALLQRLLAGRAVKDLAPAVEKLRRWQQWNEKIRQELQEHAAAGSRILIISGALDIYLPELTKDLPPHDIICTRLEVKDGRATGAMEGGNCVRARKAEMLAEYLKKNGPFTESWGYGNAPNDLPMLELLQRRIIV